MLAGKNQSITLVLLALLVSDVPPPGDRHQARKNHRPNPGCVLRVVSERRELAAS